MHQSAQDDRSADDTVTTQFGDLVREKREALGWSQRQLAETLLEVDLKLDPSAITRIERGTRDVKLAEAIAISNVLGFNLDAIAFSPAQHFAMRESTQIELMKRARKALRGALYHVDRWVNATDPDTEDQLMEKRGPADIVDLYTERLRTLAFSRGGQLDFPDGDNFVIYYNEVDRRMKQTIIDIVTNEVLLSEDEFFELREDAQSLADKRLRGPS